MSWMAVHFDCCVSTGGGDATMARQDEILAAIAALQTTADAVEVCVDEVKASTVKPDLC